MAEIKTYQETTGLNVSADTARQFLGEPFQELNVNRAEFDNIVSKRLNKLFKICGTDEEAKNILLNFLASEFSIGAATETTNVREIESDHHFHNILWHLSNLQGRIDTHVAFSVLGEFYNADDESMQEVVTEAAALQFLQIVLDSITDEMHLQLAKRLDPNPREEAVVSSKTAAVRIGAGIVIDTE
ncbi:hypothetical protein KKC94_02160 [Patescibacteria group bacterium]|nr:hypothetical protein [Patescibacteria group bacterium]